MIQTPLNQIRLTNVAVVRYKYMGKRFELACYKNKVQNYRDGVETDLNEVLQINEIFTNVSKGEAAKSDDVKKYLDKDKDAAIKVIITKGELQVSELERESEFESMKLKIANIVSTMCVNKENSVPFPVPIILKAMDDIKFNVKDSHAAKKQALQLIKELPKVLPLERAKMKIKFACTTLEKSTEVIEWMSKNYDEQENAKEGKLYLLEKTQTVENEQVELIYLIQPRLVRDITELCNKDDNLTFEIVEHYVYNKSITTEESKSEYYENQSKMEEEAKSSEPTILRSNEGSKGLNGKGAVEGEIK
jgi:ribosome maturation protein SDO1